MSTDIDTVLPLPRPVHTLAHDATLDEALHTMRVRAIRHLVITEGSAIVGIVSDSDLLRVGLPDPTAGWQGSTPVSAAVRAIVPAHPDGHLDAVIDRMMVAGATAIPVVDPIGGLLGVLTVTDLVQILRDTLDEEPSAARARLERLAANPFVQRAMLLLTEAGL